MPNFGYWEEVYISSTQERGRVIKVKASASYGDKTYLYNVLVLGSNGKHDRLVSEVPEYLLEKISERYISTQTRDSGKTFKYSGAISKSTYIKKVIYNNPATIILWSDGTKTSSKCDERDAYNPELGLTIAFLKKLYGSDDTINLLKEWIPEESIGNLFPKTISLTDVRRKQRHEK